MSKKKRRGRLGAEKSVPEVIKKDKSPYVPQGDRIDFVLNIRQRDDITPKQKELIDLILDKETKVVFINGPAGTSKTFCAIYCGLRLLNEKRMSHITYVRTVIESASKSLGSLPGDQNLKMEPFLIPLMEKMDEFLSVGDKKRLLLEERVKGIPVNYLRGSSMNAQYIICDEAQNYTRKEMTTAITRLGQFSKMIFVGDDSQSDINGSSFLMPMFDLFNDESSRKQGIHCFSFTKDDIVRSGVLKYICERLESVPKPAKQAGQGADWVPGKQAS